MGQLYVEGWAPEYGSPFETNEDLADAEKVDETVEVDGPWSPVSGVDDGIDEIAFVDGVRRIDARLTLDEPDGPIPGICGSHGVGAVIWDRTARLADFTEIEIDRLAVFGNGHGAPIPVASSRVVYRSESVPESDPGFLIQRFHGSMRKAEARLSERLAQSGLFVIADGPINDLSATEKVGYVKTHRAPYLSAERGTIVARLRAGERTPLFLIGRGGAYPRYSWYQRLAEYADGHSWTGVVRCEVSSALPLDRARAVADRTAAILPLVGSERHVDPRAPQNLVPIAALERELRRRLGDPGIIYRALRSAVAAAAEAST
ncbi:MAG: hypothetical protein QNJ77_15610 [Acidimicrobiia bacterium]|nr:hypothetical protein [Acidimicrobiia bacterium]